MFFKYKIKTDKEEIIEGEIEIGDEKLATEILSKKGTIIFLKEKKRRFFGLPFFQKIKSKDLVIFSRQLAVMVSTAMPLVKAFESLAEQTSQPSLKKIIIEIKEDIKGGMRLSASLRKFPQVFNSLFVNMVKTGETVGKLDEVLNYLADEQEKDYELRNKIKGALIYPLIIFCLVVVVLVIMMTFIIPRLSSLIIETGMQLPITTRILISLSNFFVKYWWLVFGILISAIFLFKKITQRGKGREILDRMKIKLPIFGEIFQKIYLIQFSRSLSTLLTGGTPLILALKVVEDVVPNTLYKELISQTSKEVEEGRSIATAFSKSKEIPAMISQMLVVGEQTGQIDLVLNKMANFYAREVEGLIGRLASLMEPLIIIFLGFGVAIMVSAIILPIYNLASAGL